ncbi:MAG: hypothetical protein P8J89_02545 [Phycisphaerales bacterium]|nr:hypothetical protein [Phycisphaerales bacterium]
MTKVQGILAMLAAVCLFSAEQSWADSQGLLGHWSFDDSDSLGVDMSEQCQDGIVTGCEPRPGIHGHAMFADGDDWIDLTASNAMETIGELGQGTLSMWFRFDRQPGFAEAFPLFYIGTGSGGESSGYCEAEIGHFNSVRNLYFTVLREVNNSQPAIPLCFKSAQQLEIGQWYHFVVTVGDDGNAGYLDGVPMSRTFPFGDKTIKAFFRNVTDRAVCWIGRGFLGSVETDQYHEGMLDEIMIWDRPIAVEEVTALYQAGRQSADLVINELASTSVIGIASLHGAADGVRSMSYRVDQDSPIDFDAQLQWAVDVPIPSSGSHVVTIQHESHFGEVIEESLTIVNVDLNGDAILDIEDLLLLLASWSQADGDLDGDEVTGINDLLLLLDSWQV